MDCTTLFASSSACTVSEATACISGYYLDTGACEDCPSLHIGSTECTELEATACDTGYTLESGACVEGVEDEVEEEDEEIEDEVTEEAAEIVNVFVPASNEEASVPFEP